MENKTDILSKKIIFLQCSHGFSYSVCLTGFPASKPPLIKINLLEMQNKDMKSFILNN